VLRAFQGVGGGACFALSVIMLVEMVEPNGYAAFVSYMNIAVALALVLGPIIGGAISLSTSWKWIFLLK
jgi:MFS family permease